MSDVQLSATPKGNGFQASVAFSSGVCISSAETFPSIGEAIAAAAMKLLAMPERLASLTEDEAGPQLISATPLFRRDD